jgi:adenine deaminase
MATLNAATYLHLDDHLGGVAPGRLADLVLLPDLSSFRPQTVVAGGRVVAREGELAGTMPGIDWEPLRLGLEFRQGKWLEDPSLYDGRPDEALPVIEFVSDVITRLGEAPEEPGLPDGYLRAVHISRDGRWISRALVRNFARDIEGFATTATSSGHLLVLGREREAMALAASRVLDLGGGMSLAGGGRLVWEASLPLAGIMTSGPFEQALFAAREMKAHLRSAGYPFSEALYSLLFLTADFLPGPRLTWSGVLDVRTGKLVNEAEPSRE